jgi:sugar phosphate isomerase/epimerase
MHKMNRRTLLKGTAAFAAAAWAGVPVRATSDAPGLGIQLYTLRNSLAKDFAGTLNAIGKIGYGEVETAGLLNQEPRAFRAALDAAGLSAPSGHIFPNAAQPLLYKMASGQLSTDEAWAQIEAPMTIERLGDEVSDMVEQARVIGYRYLVLASMDPKLFDSMAGIKRVITAFQNAGELCHQHGLKFAWHPHLQDWGVIEGKRAAEHVLDATDPNRVFVELDFFWAAMVNVDVPQFLRRYRGRVHLGHIKDFAKNAVVPAEGFKDFSQIKEEYFEDVGYGRLDFKTWIPLARGLGMRHFFVERDYSPDALKSAERSYEPLRKLISG